MTRPIRLRLSRARGFDLQAASRAINGLPAMSVARPSTWGNGFKIRPGDEIPEYGIVLPAIETAGQAVQLHRAWLAGFLATAVGADFLAPLRGHNLACWCALDAECHGNTLLEFANAPRPAVALAKAAP
jgi:hypothetical protein